MTHEVDTRVSLYDSDNPTLEGIDALDGLKALLFKAAIQSLREGEGEESQAAARVLNSIPALREGENLDFSEIEKVFRGRGYFLEQATT